MPRLVELDRQIQWLQSSGVDGARFRVERLSDERTACLGRPAMAKPASASTPVTMSRFRLKYLGALVRRHGADDTAGRAIKPIMRADVIVIDDIGLLPVTTNGRSPLPGRRGRRR